MVSSSWSTDTISIPITQWIPCSLFSFVAFMVSLYICGLARKTWSQLTSQFPKYIWMPAFICIALGPVATLNDVFLYLNYFCWVTNYADVVLFLTQFAAMHCYKLGKMYFMFSKSKIHRPEGYRLCTFVVLSVFVFLWFVFFSVADILFFPTTDCYISHWDAVQTRDLFTLIIEDTEYHHLFLMAVFAYGYILDVVILGLIWRKVIFAMRGVKPSERAEDTLMKIKSIFSRLLILNVMYLVSMMICFCILALTLHFTQVGEGANFWSLVRSGLFPLFSIILSYCMFLMLEPNLKRYQAFLKILGKFKLYYCCFCLCKIVRDEYRYHLSLNTENATEMATMRSTDDVLQSTVCMSPREHGIPQNGMELSVETRTVVNAEESTRL